MACAIELLGLWRDELGASLGAYADLRGEIRRRLFGEERNAPRCERSTRQMECMDCLMGKAGASYIRLLSRKRSRETGYCVLCTRFGSFFLARGTGRVVDALFHILMEFR